jgi:EamA-like transporter family protein
MLLLASFLGVPVQFLVQFYGLSLTTVSHAALMVGTMPVLLALAASLFTQERLDAVGWVALVGSTIGVALIVLGDCGGRRHTDDPRARCSYSYSGIVNLRCEVERHSTPDHQLPWHHGARPRHVSRVNGEIGRYDSGPAQISRGISFDDVLRGDEVRPARGVLLVLDLRDNPRPTWR